MRAGRSGIDEQFLGRRVGPAMLWPGAPLGMAQLMQQVLHAGQAWQHGRLGSDDPLQAFAPEHADLIIAQWAGLDPLARFLLCCSGQAGRIAVVFALVDTPFSPLPVVARTHRWRMRNNSPIDMAMAGAVQLHLSLRRSIPRLFASLFVSSD